MRAQMGGADPAASYEICLGQWDEELGRTGDRARLEKHTHTPTYVHNQHTLGVTPKTASKPLLSHPSRASRHTGKKKQIIYLFILFSLEVPGFYVSGKP